ncbi:hypothetical protein Lsan_2153 [Legionella santicrucis]|uniref:Uncharacterized protein n=1 Tax=Legionella santicrucis TaxID=45074 RepID=A0A0W0YRS6_9GAMM|nr:hypothetical protein [Legionella santicrucis]KTD59562.1 hypothetical protein Lsan_2153 [Legionella santicrucis]
MKNEIFDKTINWTAIDILVHGYAYSAEVDGQHWNITLNPDFPLEPLYTLHLNDKNMLDFTAWPEKWTIKAEKG